MNWKSVGIPGWEQYDIVNTLHIMEHPVRDLRQYIQYLYLRKW